MAVPQRRAEEPLCLLELNPREGKQETERQVEVREEHQLLKDQEGFWVEQGELFPQVGPHALHSKEQPPHKKRTVKKEGVEGVWELQGEGPSAVAKETADSMPRLS